MNSASAHLESAEIDRLKVLNIHWGYIPGGVSNYASQIENASNYRPIEFRNLCIQAPGWPVDSVNMRLMNMNVLNISGRLDLSWMKHARAYIQKEKPALILTHGFSGAFAAFISSAWSGIPVVNTWHGEYYPTTLGQKIRKPLVDIMMKNLLKYFIKEIVTVSKYSKSVLLRYGIDEKKITVIHNGIQRVGVEAYSRDSVIRELNILGDNILIGTACRLDAAKGLAGLIIAAEAAMEQRQDLRFVIWGEGPQRKMLEAMIRRRGLNKFIYLPGYRSDIERCLPSLDIYVVSSSLENFSISILEAMKAKLAIIATKVGGNPEAIRNGIDGLLVPAGDPEALSMAILSLAADSDLRNRLANSARQRFLDSFTSDRMVSKTADWLYNCAEKYKTLH